MNTISIDCWLVVSEGQRYSRHGNGNVRLAIKKPALRPGELPIHCNIQIPGALFRQPQFTAKITLPDSGQSQSDVKIQEALQDIAAAAERNIGIKISFESNDV